MKKTPNRQQGCISIPETREQCRGDVCTGTADVSATCFVNGDSHFPNHVTCRKIPVSKVTDFVSSHARQLKSADTDGVSVLSFSRKCPERKSIPPSGAFSQRRQMTGFLFFFGCNPCIFTRFLCYREKTHDFSQETFTQSAFFVHKACFCSVPQRLRPPITRPGYFA